MFVFKLCLLTFILHTCFAGEQDVLDLTDDDFSSKISSHETVLVMFYAPWCGHCKRLKPEYAKAAEDLKVNDPPIILAKIDCTEAGKSTCNEHSVSGYPTLKIFRNGEMSQEYNGPREAAGIVKYMKAQVGPSSKELDSVKALEEFIGKEDVAVVGFFEKETELKVNFFKLADKLRESVRFGHSSYEDVLKKQGISNGIVLFRPKHLHNKFEPAFIVYEGPEDNLELHNWINKHYHGLVGHRVRDNAKDFKNPLIVAYYNVDYVKNVKGTNYWRNRILKVAKNFESDYTFAISSKDDFQHELNEFSVDYIKGDKPAVFARDDDNKKYKMNEEFSMETFEQFLNDLKAKKLTPFLKSEAVPDSNDGPVKIAVGKNFDEVVMNNDKDTLVEFYAPWCGHCKKLAPVFDELGDKLKNEEVSIVKMDATSNDVPGDFDVRGFPTLYWLPKNNKKNPVKYDGGRELNDFISYIAKHATNELNEYDRKGNPKKIEL